MHPLLHTPAVKSVLGAAWLMKNLLFLADVLDRMLYLAVNTALKSAGGKWSKHAKGHLFAGVPRPVTPVDVARRDPAASLASGTKRSDDQPREGSGLERNQLDRRTAGAAATPGQRVTPEHGQAVRDQHFRRLLEGPLREGSAFARPNFDWSPGTASLDD